MENREIEYDPRALAVAEQVRRDTRLKNLPTEIDHIFESEDSCVVNSLNISRKVKECMKFLRKDSTTSLSKIKICDFLCDKLYQLYRLPIDKREVIQTKLGNVVYEDEELPTPIRLAFLAFRNEQVSYHVCVDLFERNVSEKMDIIPYFQILKYILRPIFPNTNISTQVLDDFEVMFRNPLVSPYTQMEIADIFILNGREARGNEMLNMIRALEREPIDGLMGNLGDNPVYDDTVYGDSQNVHSSNVNTSVLKACIRLMELYPPIGFNADEIVEEMTLMYPRYRKSIEKVMERIQIDTSQFRCEDNLFTLYDVFGSLWKYIGNNPQREELVQRLVEEMESMALYCTTGHLSRLINTIQGYTTDEKLQIRISDFQQIYSVIKQFLDKALMDAPEEVVISMIDDNKIIFYDFTEKIVNKNMEKILEEYGDVEECILESIQKYTDCDLWKIKDKNIKRIS